MNLTQISKSGRRGRDFLPLSQAGMGVGYPPDALPDAPLGVRARISRARALWVLGGEALSVRATSWGAHSGVQTLRSVRAPSLSRALSAPAGSYKHRV